MGGGRQCLQSTVKNSSADPIDTWACYRSDNRNLFETWRMDKEAKGASYKIVQNNRELFELDTNTDYVLGKNIRLLNSLVYYVHVVGVFANGHMKMDHERARGTNGTPSLTNMTTKAIDLLKKNKKGFLLVVRCFFHFLFLNILAILLFKRWQQQIIWKLSFIFDLTIF